MHVTADALDAVFGFCLHLEARTDPSVHIELAFDERGCGVPFTKLAFSGAMSVDGARDADGATRLDLAFADLDVAGARVDGALHLASSDRRFAYRADRLAAGAGDALVTLDGAGTAAIALDAVEFDGDGSIAYAGRALSFRADGVHRSFRSCWPDAGTMEISLTNVSETPITGVVRFGGDDHGKVALDWRGETFVVQLPARGCE